jgi:hypothetical protein
VPQLPTVEARAPGPAAPAYLGGSGGGGSGGRAPPPPLPEKKGYVRIMVEASDGPRRPPPPTAWVAATTYEAAALEKLEGRHPLALAHFANHATAALPPNAMVAPVRFRLRRPPARGGGGVEGGGEGGGDGGGDGEWEGPERGEEVWLRAYVPFLPYAMEPGAPSHLLGEVGFGGPRAEGACWHQGWACAREGGWGARRGACAARPCPTRRVAKRPQSCPAPAPPRGPQEAVGMGLVALGPIGDGEEVVFNYR